MRRLGLVLLLVGIGILGTLGQPQTPELPVCSELPAEEGLRWECSGDELLGSLAQTLKLYAEHLTAVLHNPPRDIQLLLYNYKQEQSTMPISKSYRIYKEQLMLPTEEILNPWDFSFGGDGSIFFINRKSPETIYFLEAPKKDPDCEVDWNGLFWDEVARQARFKEFVTVRDVFTEDAPITQNIKACYYLPTNVPIWKHLIMSDNSDSVQHPERFHLMNPVAQNRKFLLQTRDMDVNYEGEHWITAFALENYLTLGEWDEWMRIFASEERGEGIMLRDTPYTWEDMKETIKIIVGTINLPSYSSEFPFEQYIKNNATLWRPQELEAELSPEFDYREPWPFIDIPVGVELTEPIDFEQLKVEFQTRYAASLEELRSRLEAFGADPSILAVGEWRFEAPSEELPPGSYLVTVDGTLELTDPSQPASDVYFREITIALEHTEP